MPRPWPRLPTYAAIHVELAWPLLTMRFVMEATGFKQLCVSYLGQVELGAKTAVLYRATWQVREMCRHGGVVGRAGTGLCLLT